MVGHVLAWCLAVTLWLSAAAQNFDPELERRRQRDTVGDSNDRADNDFLRCDRPCLAGEPPKLCYYHFTLEAYHTMGRACNNCPRIRSDCFNSQCVTADGYERGLYTVNRKLPGPSIQVCLGDRIVVDLHNMMPGKTTTIHWHGIFQQGTPYMDGVPMVTQCPITEGAMFRYNFLATHAGTHFWHSHDGLQKMDGILGSLIVRQPSENDPNSGTYDFDLPAHYMLVVDWMSTDADQKLPGWRNREPGQEPVSYLINGRGRLPMRSNRRSKREALFFDSFFNDAPSAFDDTPPVFDDSFESPESRIGDHPIYGNFTRLATPPINFLQRIWPLEFFAGGGVNEANRPPRPRPPPSSSSSSSSSSEGSGGTRVLRTPFTVYTVARGLRYRFRLIGGMCLHCPAEVTIENHRLLLISTDGTPVVPVYVNSIVFLPGERFDFVLEATERVGTYWIHVKGLGPCEDVLAHQVAILRYVGSNNFEPRTRHPGYRGFPKTGLTFNPIDARCAPEDRGICISQLRSTLPVSPRLLGQPQIQMVFGFDFHTFDANQLFRPGNYQRFLQPPVPVVVGSMMNNISNVMPASPLLTQIRDIPQEKFCPPGPNGFTECPIDYCECLHLVKVPLGALVELIFADMALVPGDLHHPFHLHGHEFYVVAVGQFPREQRGIEGVRRLRDGRLKMERVKLPDSRQSPGTFFTAKDTVQVPSSGYAGVRFIADNPGYWNVHCHFIYHQVTGMNLVLQVGEHNEIPQPRPPFQTCGDYVPPVDFRGYK